jgi:hypothetical protein
LLKHLLFTALLSASSSHLVPANLALTKDSSQLLKWRFCCHTICSLFSLSYDATFLLCFYILLFAFSQCNDELLKLEAFGYCQEHTELLYTCIIFVWGGIRCLVSRRWIKLNQCTYYLLILLTFIGFFYFFARALYLNKSCLWFAFDGIACFWSIFKLELTRTFF